MRSVLASLPVIVLATCCSGSQPIDFDTQVMPILTRQGCNAGSCHGAAIGRGGLKLSLLGSDAAADHDAIVRELRGRRVNLSQPDDSLVLLKPSEQVEHEGGLRLDDDSESYELLRRWIAEGARRQGDRKLARLEVQPTEVTLPRPGQTFSIRVTASFNDGSKGDVTASTVPDRGRSGIDADRSAAWFRQGHAARCSHTDRALLGSGGSDSSGRADHRHATH